MSISKVYIWGLVLNIGLCFYKKEVGLHKEVTEIRTLGEYSLILSSFIKFSKSAIQLHDDSNATSHLEDQFTSSGTLYKLKVAKHITCYWKIICHVQKRKL